MSPPSAATPSMRPRVFTTRARRPGVNRLDPARPAAVIVPPITMYFALILITTILHGSLTSSPSILTLLRVAVLAAIQLPLLYGIRAVVESRGGTRWARVLLPIAAAILVLILDTLVPGERLHAMTLGVLFLLSVTAQPLARLWRDWWVRHRPARVTLLASSEWGADEAIRRLEEIPGLQVTGALIPGCDPATAERLLGRPTSNEVRGCVSVEKRIVVSCPMRDPSVGGTIAQLVALGHGISSESAVFRNAEGRVDTDKADPLNLLLSRPRHWFYDAVSRVANVVATCLLLVLLSPVMLIAAAAVVIETGKPIFYRQRRVGMGGRPIEVIKFRSMRQDAEELSGPVWAEEDDPRITRVGRVLRKSRVDELPQLFNVLRGDMALVGPRPERPHFFDQLRRDVPIFELRTCVRPGITGWAQVRVPYAAGVEDSRTKLEYDLYYVLHRSLWVDLAILLDTVGVALGSKGAR